MYTHINFRTKKALKEAVANGVAVRVYQPGGMFDVPAGPGSGTVEGPHYPEPHRWYASVTYDENHVILKVK
jgi:hypothetical protein